jgi:hypothetical protein
MRGVQSGSRSGGAVGAAAALLVVGACGGSNGGDPPGPANQPTGGAAARAVTAEDFDRTKFSRSATVDNPWLPLRPGRQLVYEGLAIDDEETGERVPHRLVSIVTDLSKVIDGVRTVVLWERDYSRGQVVEAELAFFAQDDAGNVWHLGEYPEEYENGKMVGAPAWIAGKEGAKPGIAMRTAPAVGTPDYAQGFAPAVDWFDRGKVLRAGERTCVKAGCFDDVLVIDEFSQDEPGAHQQKYHARGVGSVRVGWSGDDPSQETLELVARTDLSPAELAAARAAALTLERSAYRVRPSVYGHTAPAEQAR